MLIEIEYNQGSHAVLEAVNMTYSDGIQMAKDNAPSEATKMRLIINNAKSLWLTIK